MSTILDELEANYLRMGVLIKALRPLAPFVARLETPQGMPTPRRGYVSLSDERRRDIISMRSEGISIPSIAEQTGASISTVNRVLKQGRLVQSRGVKASKRSVR